MIDRGKTIDQHMIKIQMVLNPDWSKEACDISIFNLSRTHFKGRVADLIVMNEWMKSSEKKKKENLSSGEAVGL